MKKSYKLFLYGLAVHFLFCIVIISSNSLLRGLWQKDEGQLTWLISLIHADSQSYIESADNFIKNGVFGKGQEPDYHRTIGLPVIIYVFKVIFSKYWYFAFTIFQIIITAFIYPLVYLIGRIMLQKDSRSVYYAAIAIMLLGGYFIRCLDVLTDLFFSISVLAGIYLSLLAVTNTKNSIIRIILAMLLFSFGALIRPNLLLYPIAHVLLLIYVSKSYSTWIIPATKRIIWISGILLVFLCNISSFRMYHNYKIFTSTDILGINMFNFTSMKILTRVGETAEYQDLAKKIRSENDWPKKDELRKQYFYETIGKYPFQAIRYWTGAAQSHLLSPHYTEIAELYGYNYHNTREITGREIRKSTAILIMHITLIILNFFLIVVPFALYLWNRLIVHREYLFVISIITLIMVILGPSFLASTSPRMRIQVEPFIIIYAFEYWSTKSSGFIKKLRFT